jgi:hypothetical protein
MVSILLNKVKSSTRLIFDLIRRRRFNINRNYRIAGAKYVTSDPSYLSIDTFPDFQKQLEVFKNLIRELVSQSKASSFFKFGDGDYYFLTANEVGSAKPGKRALSRPYSEIGLENFVSRSTKNDFYLCEIPPHNQALFKNIFPTLSPSFPAEYVYGLTANHWLTREFAGKIGIIGAEEKLIIIKELLKSPIYQSYLGLEKFEDYIYIPQKYACDDLEGTLESLKSQLTGANATLFLVGVGHVKSGIMSELPKFHPAVYLDIGSGVDALAGVIDTKRPYFANWTNYRLADSSYYENLDLLQYNYGNEVRLITQN